MISGLGAQVYDHVAARHFATCPARACMFWCQRALVAKQRRGESPFKQPRAYDELSTSRCTVKTPCGACFELRTGAGT